MTLTVPEESVEEVLDFLKNAILDAMSAENTRQSAAQSSSRLPDDDRGGAPMPPGEGAEPLDAEVPMSIAALLRMLEEELVADADELYSRLPKETDNRCQLEALR